MEAPRNKQSLINYVLDKYKAANKPICAAMELTYGCNLKCVHCYVPNYNDIGDELLTLDEIDRVTDDLGEMGVFYITLTGGELFTRKDWFEILSCIAGKGFLLLIFTNATMINEDVAKKLSKINPNSIEVSLYGGDVKTYENVTGISGSFDSFQKGIRLLKNHDLNAFMKPVIIKQNVHEYKNIIAFAEENDYELVLDFSPHLIPDFTDKGSGLDYTLTDDEIENLFLTSRDGIFCRETISLCGPAIKGLVIGPGGDVRTCIVNPHIAGNIRNKKLEDIWKDSPVFKELRCLTKSNFAECSTCELRYYCQPCIALNIIEHGKVTKPAAGNCRIARIRKKALEKVGNYQKTGGSDNVKQTG